MLFSPSYALPYLILIVFYIMLAMLEYYCVMTPRIKLAIRILCISGCIIFFGFRGLIGWDWTNYYQFFQEIPPVLSENFPSYLANSFVEKGFITYMAVIKQIWPEYHFFIFVSTFIDLIIVSEFIKRYVPQYALGFLVFILMGGFGIETDLLRNAKSIVIFLVSLKYLEQRKWLPYFVLNILGTLFHLSSALYLPLYFFFHREISRKLFILIFLVGNIIFLLQIEFIKPLVFTITGFIGGKFSYLARLYFETEYGVAYGISIGYIERTLSALLLIAFYNKLIKINRSHILFINAFIFYFILYFYFAEASVVATRLGGLFNFSYWILWPAFLSCFNWKIYRSVYLTYVFCYSLLKMYGLSHSILYKYDNILFGSEQYSRRYQTFQKVSEELKR